MQEQQSEHSEDAAFPLAWFATLQVPNLNLDMSFHGAIANGQSISVKTLSPNAEDAVSKFCFKGAFLREKAELVAQGMINRMTMQCGRLLKQQVKAAKSVERFKQWMMYRIAELLILVAYISLGIDTTEDILKALDSVLAVLDSKTRSKSACTTGEGIFGYPSEFLSLMEIDSSHGFYCFGIPEYNGLVTWFATEEFLKLMVEEGTFNREYFLRNRVVVETPCTYNCYPLLPLDGLSNWILGCFILDNNKIRRYRKELKNYVAICDKEVSDYKDNKSGSSKRKRDDVSDTETVSSQEEVQRPKKKYKSRPEPPSRTKTPSRKKMPKRKSIDSEPKKIRKAKSSAKSKPPAQASTKKKQKKSDAKPVSSQPEWDIGLQAFWKRTVERVGETRAILTYGKDWTISPRLLEEYQKYMDERLSHAGGQEFASEETESINPEDAVDLEDSNLVKEDKVDHLRDDEDMLDLADHIDSDDDPTEETYPEEFERIETSSFLLTEGAGILHQMALLNKRVGDAWLLLTTFDPEIVKKMELNNTELFGLRVAALDRSIEADAHGSVFKEATISEWMQMLNTSTLALSQEVQAAVKRAKQRQRTELSGESEDEVIHIDTPVVKKKSKSRELEPETNYFKAKIQASLPEDLEKLRKLHAKRKMRRKAKRILEESAIEVESHSADSTAPLPVETVIQGTGSEHDKLQEVPAQSEEPPVESKSQAVQEEQLQSAVALGDSKEIRTMDSEPLP